jgi:ParB/RepB/Spo0J family partition protein
MNQKLSALAKLTARAAPVTVDGSKEVEIPLDKIRFDPTQPRQAFHHLDGRISEEDEKAVDELAESIGTQGLIQAITVEPIGDGTYRLLVGERRTRAFLKLGRPTIRAVIRNLPFPGRKKRQIYQLAENISRQDLSDADISKSISDLMQDSDGEPGLSKSEIAREFGKAPDWVTRYLRFGDEELQRLWVQTGIADTVEKVYRLSILPAATQADIQRRVRLAEGDPERLETPLLRSVIDDLWRDAKSAKAGLPQGATPPAPTPMAAAAPISPPGQGQTSPDAAGEQEAGATAPQRGVDATLASMAQAGRESKAPPPSGSAASHLAMLGAAAGGEYKLPEGAREAILAASSGVLQDGVVQLPINVRVPMGCLLALLDKLSDDDQTALGNVQLSVNLPGPLAERIANVLTGRGVDPSEVPATVQNELVKLRLGS